MKRRLRLPEALGVALLALAGCEEGTPRSKAGKGGAVALPGEAIQQTKEGDAAKVRAMVEQNPAFATERDDAGLTLLYHAAVAGKAEVVETLLAKGADPKVADEKGVTPLHAAARAGYAAVVKALLAKGADPNAKTKAGETPLYAATDHVAALPQHAGCVEVVKLLLAAKADPNAKGPQDDTALHVAAKQGHKDIAELLLAAKADPNAKANADAYEETPLHRAVVYDHQDIVELLLAHGADINAKDLHGRTPLARVRHMRHRALAEFLEQKGATE